MCVNARHDRPLPQREREELSEPHRVPIPIYHSGASGFSTAPPAKNEIF
jgi:hypothetical protein